MFINFVNVVLENFESEGFFLDFILFIEIELEVVELNFILIE
jgi:hypothetical protein